MQVRGTRGKGRKREGEGGRGREKGWCVRACMRVCVHACARLPYLESGRSDVMRKLQDACGVGVVECEGQRSPARVHEGRAPRIRRQAQQLRRCRERVGRDGGGVEVASPQLAV